METVTKREQELLNKGICPDCNGQRFLEGPHGGLAVNIQCANTNCEARFNIRWPFTPERLRLSKLAG